MPSVSDFFHVGIVVPEITSACEHLSQLIGVSWGPLVETDLPIRDGRGEDRVIAMRIRFTTAFPYIEVIEERAGSPWECNKHSNLHHLAYFCGDVPAGSGQLTSKGCPLEFGILAEGVMPANVVCHRDPLGLRFELLSLTLRAQMEETILAPG